MQRPEEKALVGDVDEPLPELDVREDLPAWATEKKPSRRGRALGIATRAVRNGAGCCSRCEGMTLTVPTTPATLPTAKKSHLRRGRTEEALPITTRP